MELKTIKDFEDGWKDYDRIFIKKLKQEIIERAKSYLEEINESVELIEIGADSECVWKFKKTSLSERLIGKVEELVEFYNLTEKDLK